MAFFGYSELLTLSASDKEGRGQPGKCWADWLVGAATLSLQAIKAHGIAWADSRK